MKKIFLLALLFSPSLLFAQRFGSIKTSNDVSLSSNTILNTSTAESKTFNVSSGSVTNQLNLYDSGSVYPFVIQRSTVVTNNSFMDFHDCSPSVTCDQFVWFTQMRAGTTAPDFSIVASTQNYYYAADQTGDAVLTLGARNSSFESAYIQLKFGLGSGLDPLTSVTFSNGAWDMNSVVFKNIGGVTAGSLNVYSGTLGSQTGNIQVNGSTINFTAPPVDSLDRLFILNSGSVTYPVAAGLGSTQTWTGGNNFTSLAGSTFTSIMGTSITLSGLTASSLVKTDGNKALASVSNSGADGTKFLRDDFTWQAAAGGSGPFTNATSSTNLSMAGFTISNLGASSWPVNISSHPWLQADFTIVSGTPTIPGLSCTLAANTTYTFICECFFKGSGSTSPGGVKYQVTLPNGSTAINWRLGGSHNAGTATRFDQGAGAVASYNGTAVSAYASQTNNLHHFSGGFATGNSTGVFNLLVSNQGGGSPLIEQYSNLHVYQVSP